jgi:hypothetical protein
MNRISIILALALAVAACTETEVVIEDHYGVCTADEQCPGTYVCQQGYCVEPEEPVAACEPYEWMGNNSTWYCWCDGDNCAGPSIELPWSCPFDLLDDPSSEVCGIQCHDHFWLGKDMIFIDRLGDPPMVVIDNGNGLVTCTQHVDTSPLRFVRSQTAAYSSPANGVAGVDLRLTHSAMVIVSYRFSPTGTWQYGGFFFTNSIPGGPTHAGNIRQGGYAPGTTIYWHLQAKFNINDPGIGDIWEGVSIL